MSDTEMPDDDDDLDEEEQYNAWKFRELERVLNEREAREAQAKEVRTFLWRLCSACGLESTLAEQSTYHALFVHLNLRGPDLVSRTRTLNRQINPLLSAEPPPAHFVSVCVCVLCLFLMI